VVDNSPQVPELSDTDLVNAIKAQALNMGAFAKSFNDFSSKLYQVLSQLNTTVAFKANQAYTTTGWPAYLANFKMPSLFDTNNAYNASTGAFTVPYSGFYQLNFYISAANGTGSIATFNDIGFTIDGDTSESTFAAMTNASVPIDAWFNYCCSCVQHLTAGQHVAVSKLFSPSSAVPSAWRGSFSGAYLA
jgi:hypothetical protein